VFQSTPPCGGRRQRHHPAETPGMFQSTPPCGGRRAASLQRLSVEGVSIHAPVRGATCMVEHFHCFRIVSIHAPVRGATAEPASWSWQAGVSIHAPVRGATWLLKNYAKPGDVSIHAPVRGATFTLEMTRERVLEFQSTPPCGGRPPPTAPCWRWRTSFNPRPRAGGDSRPG